MADTNRSTSLLDKLLFGESLGWLRFIFLVLLIFTFGLVFAVLREVPDRAEVFLFHIFRYSLIPLSAMGVSFIFAAKYLQDIYEIEEIKHAIMYLWICIFGFPLPRLKISGGEKDISNDGFNYIDQLGGPGRLEIEAGNAVVLETLERHTRVLGNGAYRISRFERIKDIVPLEEQFGEIKEIVALTRDGIEVAVREVQYRFCVDVVSRETDLGAGNVAYPFSKRAVINLVYQRAAGANHRVVPWFDAVQGVIKSIITDHISNTDLEALVAPHFLEGHPLDELRKKFDEPKTRERLKGIGARLTFCNIGQLAMKSDDIDKQLVEAWFVKKEGIAHVIRAQGESENLTSQERGRAEGQAMLLRNISRALQEIDINEKPQEGTGQKKPESIRKKNLKHILLARTAQILESRTSIYRTGQEELKHDNKG